MSRCCFDSLTEANEWREPLRCPISQFGENKYDEVRESVYRGKMTAEQGA